MRLATLTTMLAPLSGGAASWPAVLTLSLGQQAPSNEHFSVPWLYARPQIEKPKYNPQGKPPLLYDTTDFALWRVAMQDHLRCGNDEMLEILEYGYKAVDPKNLTPREIYDKNLNDTTTMCIRRGMTDKQRRPYIHITSAKELWDTIVRTKTSTSTLRLAQYEIAKGQLQNFRMDKGESPSRSLSVS